LRKSSPPLSDSARGQAVVGVVAVEDAGAVRRLAGELDGRLDRLGARIAEEDTLDALCERLTRASARTPGRRAQSIWTRFGRSASMASWSAFLITGGCARGRRRRTREQVEVAIAPVVVEVGTLTTLVEAVEAERLQHTGQLGVHVLHVQLEVLARRSSRTRARSKVIAPPRPVSPTRVAGRPDRSANARVAGVWWPAPGCEGGLARRVPDADTRTAHQPDGPLGDPAARARAVGHNGAMEPPRPHASPCGPAARCSRSPPRTRYCRSARLDRPSRSARSVLRLRALDRLVPLGRVDPLGPRHRSIMSARTRRRHGRRAHTPSGGVDAGLTARDAGGVSPRAARSASRACRS